MIANNDLSKVIDELLSFSERSYPSYQTELLLHKAEYQEVEKIKRLGLEDFEFINRKLKKIKQALLELIEVLMAQVVDTSQQAESLPTKIFISYAWEPESEKLIKSFEQKTKQVNMKIMRDKINGVPYKGNIKEFMNDLGRQDCIIIIFSDKYLKSKNCMYEMLQIFNNSNFPKNVFPIVLSSCKIYDSILRINYVNYWQKQWEKLNTKIRKVKDLSTIDESYKDLKLYSDFKNSMNRVTEIFSNINSLTAEQHYREDFRTLIESLKG